MAKELCSIDKISEYLDVSIPFIRKLVRAKMIPHYKIGNRLKFDIKEVNEWVESHRQEESKIGLFL